MSTGGTVRSRDEHVKGQEEMSEESIAGGVLGAL